MGGRGHERRSAGACQTQESPTEPQKELALPTDFGSAK
jgi:hypothetical protein